MPRIRFVSPGSVSPLGPRDGRRPPKAFVPRTDPLDGYRAPRALIGRPGKKVF
jgi:hypothetical protein